MHNFAEVDAWLAPYRRLWSDRLDALGDRLDAMPDLPGDRRRDGDHDREERS